MVILFGAAPNTGNQGVSALCRSVVNGLAARGIDDLTIADHGRGLRREVWTLGGKAWPVNLIGVSHTRRLWRADCLRTVHFLSRIGGLGNAAAAAVIGSDAVLDVSGGDSFTDLYGEKRFQAMCLTKRLALDTGRPLILLPQTLGPFRDPSRLREAVEIMAAAHAIWVRDARSYEFLREVLGSAFDPERHHLGLDMAVLLPATAPKTRLPAPFDRWFGTERDGLIAGLNVSGLLCQSASEAQRRFGLKAEHPAVAEAAARAILGSDPSLRLALIPHVMRRPADPESDWAAATALENRLSQDFPGRVATLPPILDASELKWLIGRLDWFAGARMHATIASFSSCVPTLGLGYSDKAAGVFAACGLSAHVADLRRLDSDAVGAAVERSLRCRAESAAELARIIPKLRNRAEQQMDHIAATVRQCAWMEAAG